MKPLLVGEANPYGGDPDYALFPYPERSAGARLCKKILRLQRREYLQRFDRVNLCPEKWSVPIARGHMWRLRTTKRSVFVLLGSKVTHAFEFNYEPFTVKIACVTFGIRKFVILPHPSGLSRIWNEPGSFDKARGALKLAGIEC